MIKKMAYAFMALFFCCTLAQGAYAEAEPLKIEELTTPSGVTVWLAQSHNLPMVSVEIAFRAGAAFDPNDKRGVANLTAALLTQGAGDLDAKTFQQEKERLGARIGTQANLLNITAQLNTLTENLEASFTLFAQALREPTFAEKDFARLQQAVLSGRKRVAENPRQLAQEAFVELVYGRYHPYSQPVSGRQKSVAALTPADVKAYHRKMFTRRNMVVSVVGDVTPEVLIPLIEKHLKGLNKGRGWQKVPSAPKVQPPALRKLTLDIPQTTIVMGHQGLSRQDDDYFAALFANHILGGGGFASRLMEQVREKRGLAYGINSYFNPLPHWGAFQVVTQTKNQSAKNVVELVKKEIEAMGKNGVSEKQYTDALAYLEGSFPLRLDSNADILAYLTFMQTENLGKDYMNNWVDNIRGVSRTDIKRVVQKRLHPEQMAVVMAGNPDGVKIAKKQPIAAPAPKLVVQKKVQKAAKVKKTPKTVAKPAPIEIEEEAVAAPIKVPQAPKELKVKAKPKPKVKAKKAPKPVSNDFRELKDEVPQEPRKRRNVKSKKWL